MKYISNQIKTEGIKSWNDGDIVTIEAGTGKGKSYFIKNLLYAFAKKENKKILMLIHRTNCIDQFQNEIERDNKTDVIDIMSYQKIEYNIQKGLRVNFEDYKYIVCDEFHYFISDAAFNKTTDISLNKILGENKSIRVFLSATGDYVRRYIENYKKLEVISYKLTSDYSYIKELSFYNEDETLQSFIDESIERKEKTIMFIQSAEKAYKIYSKNKDNSIFNCSKSNKKYYKYVDKDKINNMLENEGFEESLLITTTTMDAGVNITDTEVRHIVCDVDDVGVLIQCLGRRRINKNIKDDGIFVYIKNINNNQLGGRKTQIIDRVERGRFFKKHGEMEYAKKYGRDPDHFSIVYDKPDFKNGNSYKKLNEMAYFKNEIDIHNIEEILEVGYKKYISNLFGISYFTQEEEKANNDISLFLNNIVGDVMLTAYDRKELIEKLDVRSNGKILKSLDSLNAALRERKLNFYIDKFETSRVTNGKKKNYKSAWKVLRLVDK